MQKIQRFGGAMITPVLLFAVFGIVVGITTFLQQEIIFGEIVADGTLYNQILTVIQDGGWTVFNQLNILFVVGLPIGLANKNQGHASMSAFVLYMTFTYMLSSMLGFWGDNFGVDFSLEPEAGSGLANVAGVKTLDTGMIGALIIAGIVIFLHNKFFDKRLPDWLATFSGAPTVVAIGFVVMLPVAFLFLAIWPQVQILIDNLQSFITSSGLFGIGIFMFLERLLIPTGMHHLLAKPLEFDSIIVNGGLIPTWIQSMPEMAQNSDSLVSQFPESAFLMYGISKVFAPIGISLAFYATARPEKKQEVAGLMIPVALTAIVAGVTEPIEFTFLFIAPLLFLVHAVLAALLVVTMFSFGITGHFTGGLIDWISYNWLPLGVTHWQTYLLQVAIGLVFSAIWFVVFRFLILKMDLKTPGREALDEEARLISKDEYKASRSGEGSYSESTEDDPEGEVEVTGGSSAKARGYLEALGGADNIDGVTNCMTRLRITVKDEDLVADEAVFKKHGAFGLMKRGKNVQIIDGTNVQYTRSEFDELL